MPVITYNTVADAISVEQKQALTQALTNAVGEVLGDKIKKNAWVMINELPEGNFAIGGHSLTAASLKKLIE